MRRADANCLHRLLSDAICELEKIDYGIVCVVSDNNSINRKAMSYFMTSPPLPSSPPPPPRNQKFFIQSSLVLTGHCFSSFTLHIVKHIQNNWLNQNNDLLGFYFPAFEEPTLKHMLRSSFEPPGRLTTWNANKSCATATVFQGRLWIHRASNYRMWILLHRSSTSPCLMLFVSWDHIRTFYTWGNSNFHRDYS